MEEQTTFLLRMSKELKEQLEELAKEESRSMNSEINTILKSFVRNVKRTDHNDF